MASSDNGCASTPSCDGRAQRGRGVPSQKGASYAPTLPLDLNPITVIVGYAGVGKTNLALNLALDAANEGYAVTVVDLDIVNPYFRSSGYRRLLEEAGITVVAPLFAEAGSGLDVPSLSGAVDAAISKAARGETVLIIDAGGDDEGARVLGRFAAALNAVPHDVFYVLNRYRQAVADPRDAIENIRAVGVASRLQVTGLVNNSHLKQETDAAVLAAGLSYAHEVAAERGLPLLFSTMPKVIDDASADLGNTGGAAERRTAANEEATTNTAANVEAYVDAAASADANVEATAAASANAVFGNAGIFSDTGSDTFYPVEVWVETPWGS